MPMQVVYNKIETMKFWKQSFPRTEKTLLAPSQ